MTNTAVVLGIAMLGTPEVLPDCDCAAAAAGSSAISKEIISFSGNRVRAYSMVSKKIYAAARLFKKNFLASINLCSRFSGSGITRTIIKTPAILGNNNLTFASLSSCV